MLVDFIANITPEWQWINIISMNIYKWRNKTEWSSIVDGQELKIIPNLPIWWKYLELRGIMVNKGWIHRELGKFMMISSNLIKSDNELMIEIGENGRLWRSKWGVIFENQKNEIR